MKWCDENGFKFYPVSAKEGTNVIEAFEAIAQLGYEFMNVDSKNPVRFDSKFEKITFEFKSKPNSN